MSKTHKIYCWEEWKKICERHKVDPYENADFGIDLGGGDSSDFEYIGNDPKKKKEDK